MPPQTEVEKNNTPQKTKAELPAPINGIRETDTHYYVEVDKFEGADLQIRKNGEIFGPLNKELDAWIAQNPGATVDAKRLFRQELLLKHVGKYNEAVAEAIGKQRPHKHRIAELQQELKQLKDNDDLRFAERTFGFRKPERGFVTTVSESPKYRKFYDYMTRSLSKEEQARYHEISAEIKKSGEAIPSARSYSKFPLETFSDEGFGLISAKKGDISEYEAELTKLQGKAVKMESVKECQNFLLRQNIRPAGNSDVEIIRAASNQATLLMDQADATIASANSEIESEQKKLSAIQIPQIPGENKSNPTDIDDMGKDMMVCRHRAPIAHVIDTKLGLKSELVTGNMKTGLVDELHCFLHADGNKSISDPSSNGTLTVKLPIRGPYMRDGEEVDNSVRISPSMGYDYQTISSVQQINTAGSRALDYAESLRHRAETDLKAEHLSSLKPMERETLSLSSSEELQLAKDLAFHYTPKMVYLDPYKPLAKDPAELKRWQEMEAIAKIPVNKPNTSFRGIFNGKNDAERVRYSNELSQKGNALNQMREINTRAYHQAQEQEETRVVETMLKARGLDSDAIVGREREVLAISEARKILAQNGENQYRQPEMLEGIIDKMVPESFFDWK